MLALFVAYSLWWTNVLADREADRQGDTVRSKWADGPGALDTKDGIGFLHVPAMKNGEVLVKKGTDPKTLNNGIAGYYTDPIPPPSLGRRGQLHAGRAPGRPRREVPQHRQAEER